MPDEADQDKRKKAYFFQCVAIGVFALLMMAAAAKLYEEPVGAPGLGCSDTDNVYFGIIDSLCTSLEWIIAATCILIAACGVAIVFYCCKCNPLIKWGIVVLLMVGSICYFLGKAEFMSSASGSGPSNAEVGAVAVGLFLICAVTSVQVVSEAFNDEKKRVPAFAFAMLVFGLLYPWHLLETDPRLDSQNAVIAGCFILDIALVATMVVFCLKAPEVNRMLRFCLCGAIFAGSLIMFAGLWDYYGGSLDGDSAAAATLYNMEPGVFCVLQSGILALDVLM